MLMMYVRKTLCLYPPTAHDHTETASDGTDPGQEVMRGGVGRRCSGVQWAGGDAWWGGVGRR